MKILVDEAEHIWCLISSPPQVIAVYTFQLTVYLHLNYKIHSTGGSTQRPKARVLVLIGVLPSLVGEEGREEH